MLLEWRNVTRGVFGTVILAGIGVAMVLFLIPRIGGTSFQQSVARVGNVDITPGELSRELDLALRQERNNGRNISRDDAIQQNAHLQLLDALISRAAFSQYAKRLGVEANDAQVAARIREIAPVINPITRTVDEDTYRRFLSDLHYTQPEFERTIRDEVSAQMLSEALMAGIRPPMSYGALVLAYQRETRTVTVADAPVAVVGAVPTPTDAQLQTFYQGNREAWRVPEYRAVTLVYARSSDFTSRVTVPDAQVDAELQTRRASLAQPEKRSSIRIAATSAQQANVVAARLAHGENADAVARSLSLQAIHGADEARTAVSDANVAAAVFAMTPNTPPRVVQGALAPFVVVQVTSITPAVNPDAAAINTLRAQIRQQMALEQAGDLKDAATNAFDEARGGGASTAEAARRAGLQVVAIPAVDAQGRDPAGQPIALFAGDNNELLRTVNQTAEGEASDFIPAGEGADVVISVDHITPASIQPFAQVRQQVAQRWAAQEIARRAQEFVNRVMHEIQGGRPFDAVAAEFRMHIAVNSQSINREQASHLPSRRLAAQIFSAAQGGVVSDVLLDATGHGGVLIGIVERINRFDPSQATAELQQARAMVSRGVANDLSQAIQAQVTADAHPERHEDVIRRTFRSSQDAGDANQEPAP